MTITNHIATKFHPSSKRNTLSIFLLNYPEAVISLESILWSFVLWSTLFQFFMYIKVLWWKIFFFALCTGEFIKAPIEIKEEFCNFRTVWISAFYFEEHSKQSSVMHSAAPPRQHTHSSKWLDRCTQLFWRQSVANLPNFGGEGIRFWLNESWFFNIPRSLLP